MEKACIFSNILRGELESGIVYQDELCTAFMDIQPVTPGHIVIIPNKHVELIGDLDDETVGRIFVVAKKINKALREAPIKCEGINYFLADGEAAFQEVFHTHLHRFPRYTGDGFGLTFAEQYHELPPREELDEIANRVKGILKTS